MNDLYLTETSEELVSALDQAMRLHFGTQIDVSALNTGGGTMVCAIDLSQDGRGMGRSIWLTRRDEHYWYVGFYDFSGDDREDSIGVVLELHGFHRIVDGVQTISCDDPLWVADEVVGILRRLGVTKLQGG